MQKSLRNADLAGNDRVPGNRPACPMAQTLPKLKSCIKQAGVRRRRSDVTTECPCGYLGCGQRYGLREASFILYDPSGRGGVDEAASLHQSQDSIRHAIKTAADTLESSSIRKPRNRGQAVDPSCDGTRYWFGIARGLRKAKQLLIDLSDEGRSRIGWPVYWAASGAYLFLDHDDKKGYYDFHPNTGKADYCFLKTEQAKRLVEADLKEFDHLGEVAHIPKWEVSDLAKHNPTLLASLDKPIGNIHYHHPYCGGIKKPPCANVGGCSLNSYASLIRCAAETTTKRSLVSLESGGSESPIVSWLIDTGCGHDLVGVEEVKALKRMFKAAGIPVSFQTANGVTQTREVIELYVDELGETIEPYIMASTPGVLSVGMRCNQFGYTFLWIGDNSPCFISPEGHLIVLVSERDIPYLKKGTRSLNIAEATGDELDEILRRTGLCRWHGKLAIDIDTEVPESAVPATEEVVATEPQPHSSAAPPPPKAIPGRPTRWRNKFNKCLVCAPISGQPFRTCRWFGAFAVGAPAPEAEEVMGSKTTAMPMDRLQ